MGNATVCKIASCLHGLRPNLVVFLHQWLKWWNSRQLRCWWLAFAIVVVPTLPSMRLVRCHPQSHRWRRGPCPSPFGRKLGKRIRLWTTHVQLNSWEIMEDESEVFATSDFGGIPSIFQGTIQWEGTKCCRIEANTPSLAASWLGWFVAVYANLLSFWSFSQPRTAQLHIPLLGCAACLVLHTNHLLDAVGGRFFVFIAHVYIVGRLPKN